MDASADDGELIEDDAPGGAPSTAAPSPRPWGRRSWEEIADCRVFKVRRDISTDPRDGRAHDFYVVEAPDWVNVIPLTDDGQVVLIELYRHGTGEISLEIPGGMVDPGESHAAAAARELLEETGYEAGEVTPLGRTRPNPAIQDNWIHTFVARGVVRRSEPENAGTEQTVVRLFPLDRIPSLIAEGKITHSLVVTAFHLLGLAVRGGVEENAEA